MMTCLRQLVLVALLTSSLSTWAYPTMFGDTGLVLIPTANVQSEATFTLAADHLPMKNAIGSTVSFPIRLCYGLAENYEISALIGNAADKSIGANIEGLGSKISLIDEDIYGKLPGVGVGVRAWREKDQVNGNANAVEAYAVASKTVLAQGDNIEEGFTVRMHAGVSYTSYSGRYDANFIKPFVGLSYLHVNRNALLFEYLPEQTDGIVTLRDATFSAAIRRQVSPNFYAQLGTTRAFGKSTSNAFFIGAMYRFSEENTREERRPVDY